MKALILLVLVFVEFTGADKITNLIKSAGYPAETHQVLTPDGFTLKIHRIPRAKPNKESHIQSISSKSPKESVLLVHGLTTYGICWVIVDPKNSLAFKLADAKYDVWILNVRGTSHSMKHEKFNSDDERFWNYSFHDIGYFDIPTVTDYILANTNSKRLKYVGHSQGATVLLVALSTRPEYNSKISSAHLINPAAYFRHLSRLQRLGVQMYKNIEATAKFMHIHAVIYSEALYDNIFERFCKNGKFCENMLFEVIGEDSGQLNSTKLLSFIKHLANNFSLKQLLHFGQLARNGEFQMFDYETENYHHFGVTYPPRYDLDKISVPLWIIYGTKDALVNSNDVELLISKLKTVKGRVKLPWNHLDCLLGDNVDVKVNQYILKTMKYGEN